MSKKIKKMPNINARDFATILGINPYMTPFQLLEQKIENKHPFFGNIYTEHGNRYEKDAINCYELQTGNNVDSDQKNTTHPNYSWITGRFDGVTYIKKTLKKRKLNSKNIGEENLYIVEIKCPFKKDRTEPLTLDNIPEYYLAQCQVYMNMLDCDNTHYVEYYITPDEPLETAKLYYINVVRDRNWWNESLPKIKAFRKELEKYHELGSLDTHPVRIKEKEWENNFDF